MYNNNLYNARKERGKTQAELAKAIGLNTNVYSRYERGDRDIPLSVAAKMALVLGVSIDYIACYSKNKLGIGYDKDEEYIKTNFYNPIMENSSNQEEANRIAIQQIQKAIAELSKDVNSIMNEKYPDEQ